MERTYILIENYVWNKKCIRLIVLIVQIMLLFSCFQSQVGAVSNSGNNDIAEILAGNEVLKNIDDIRITEMGFMYIQEGKLVLLGADTKKVISENVSGISSIDVCSWEI